jgi:hypothetical protein
VALLRNPDLLAALKLLQSLALPNRRFQAVRFRQVKCFLGQP